jgi:ATP-dependent protease Clp ATPase subunit
LVNGLKANEESPLSGLIPCLTRPHDAIVTAYKQRFQQQAVGIVIRPACASF